jgi:hypothetical protein
MNYRVRVKTDHTVCHKIIFSSYSYSVTCYCSYCYTCICYLFGGVGQRVKCLVLHWPKGLAETWSLCSDLVRSVIHSVRWDVSGTQGPLGLRLGFLRPVGSNI